MREKFIMLTESELINLNKQNIIIKRRFGVFLILSFKIFKK